MKSDLHGWLIIDKPAGLTSARVVGAVKRATGAKVGHAGTLDPLATGILPLALGEATKTVQFATAGRKRYRFRVRWGMATDTDDREGEVVAETPARPDPAAIAAALPRLHRHDLAAAARLFGDQNRRAPRLRAGPRRSAAHARRAPGGDRRAAAAGRCPIRTMPSSRRRSGKVPISARSPAIWPRRSARSGHIVELRRLAVGRFTEAQAISLESAVALGHSLAASEHLLPIETALDDIPALALTAAEAARLRHGQRVPVRRDRLAEGTLVGAWHDRLLVALARIEAGGLRPVRIINR